MKTISKIFVLSFAWMELWVAIINVSSNVFIRIQTLHSESFNFQLIIKTGLVPWQGQTTRL